MSHIPTAGDRYIVTRPFETFGTRRWESEALKSLGREVEVKGYSVGDMLFLHEPTGLDPFGYASSICNWVVECKFFKPPQDESVWSGIWMMIEGGLIIWETDQLLDSMAREIAEKSTYQ